VPITVKLEPDLLEKLNQIALERGQSIEEIVVTLLTQITGDAKSKSSTHPVLPEWIGSAKSGIPDLGVNYRRIPVQNASENTHSDFGKRMTEHSGGIEIIRDGDGVTEQLDRLEHAE